MALRGPRFAIASQTALEAVRRPVYLLVLLSVVAGSALLPFLLNYTLGDAASILRDSTLALALTGGLVLAALSAADAVGGEFRRGSAAAALSKPVSRNAFFLAKLAGLAAALAAFLFCSLCASVLAVRAGSLDGHVDQTAELPLLLAIALSLLLAAARNRRTGRSFSSSLLAVLLLALPCAVLAAALSPTPFDGLRFPENLQLSVFAQGFLLFCLLAMFSTFSAALAIHLSPTPVLLLTAALFSLGLLSDSLLGPRLSSPAALALFALIPDVQAFWLADALRAAIPIPPSYLLLCALYALLWSAALTLPALLLLRHREISPNP